MTSLSFASAPVGDLDAKFASREREGSADLWTFATVSGVGYDRLGK